MSVAVTDRIRRGQSGESPFAVAWQDDLKVAFVTVATVLAMEAIPEWKRLPYMTVYVIATNEEYTLGADTTIAGQVWTPKTYGLPADVVVEGDIFDIDGYIKPQLIQNIFLNSSYVVASEAAMLALTTSTGNFVIRTDTTEVFIKLNNTNPAVLGDFALASGVGSVLSVNGDIGVVTVSIASLLAEVGNLADFNDAVSNNVTVLAHSTAISTLDGDIATVESNLSALDAYVLTHLGTKLLSATAASPSFAQDGYVLKWDNTANEYILAPDAGAGGGGVSTFLELTDVPLSYSGQALKGVRVNVGETGLEFYTPSAGFASTTLTTDVSIDGADTYGIDFGLTTPNALSYFNLYTSGIIYARSYDASAFPIELYGGDVYLLFNNGAEKEIQITNLNIQGSGGAGGGKITFGSSPLLYSILTPASIATSRDMTIPTLAGNDTFVFQAHSQTLTNKTLTSPVITTSLTTGSTSFDLLNTTATTVNFAGAATVLNIGTASTGNTFLRSSTIIMSQVPETDLGFGTSSLLIRNSGGAVNKVAASGGSSTVYLNGAGTWSTPSGGMVYPGAGIPLSTGSAWSTSITNNSANWNTAYGWGDHAGLYAPISSSANYWKTAGTSTLTATTDIITATYAFRIKSASSGAAPRAELFISPAAATFYSEQTNTSAGQIGTDLTGGYEQAFIRAYTSSGTIMTSIQVDNSIAAGVMHLRGDGVGFAGAVYYADYTANFGTRSLIDKGYADTNYTTTSSNAITKTTGNFKLGGALVENTTITGATGTYALTLGSNSAGQIESLTSRFLNGMYFSGSASTSTAYISSKRSVSIYADGDVNDMPLMYAISNFGGENGNYARRNSIVQNSVLTGLSLKRDTNNGVLPGQFGIGIKLGFLVKNDTVGDYAPEVGIAYSLADVTDGVEDGSYSFSVNVAGPEQIITYLNQYGFRYNADYSASWTDRYLIDKGYADATYAATGHTHTLANVTDVTATVAEVNLLDLSGLTVGWVLSADSATTASWKAPTGGGATTLDGLTDVVITAAAINKVIQHNGTNWVDQYFVNPVSTPTLTANAYTLVATDHGGILHINNGATAATVNLPAGLATNFQCTIVNKGTGIVTLTPTGGSTLASDGTTIEATNTGVSVYHAGSNAWTAMGSLGAPLTLANITGTLPVASGGTNITTYAVGDILYASGATTLTKLAAGTDTHVLTLAGGVPTWAASAGGGNVTKVGTPVNNQVGVWTGDGTIEGDTALTFDTATDTLATVDLSLSNDLLLATGSIINWNAGDLTLTHAANLLTLAGGDLAVPDDAYGAGWNGSAVVPTKNAIYDKVQTLVTGTITIELYNGGSDLTTGIKDTPVQVPYGATITGWEIAAYDASNALLSTSIVVDILSDSFANLPLIGTDSIAGTEKPTLTAASTASDNTITTWSAITAGNYIQAEIESVSAGTKKVVITIKLTKS